MYGLKIILEASLEVQWLRLHASSTGDKDLILVGELSSHKLCGVVKKKKKRKKRKEKKVLAQTSLWLHIRE